jgi:hypothetical protein
MKNNPSRPIAILTAIILGFVIYKHFNFSTLTLKDPWLDVLYIVTFVILLFFLFKEKFQSKHKK